MPADDHHSVVHQSAKRADQMSVHLHYCMVTPATYVALAVQSVQYENSTMLLHAFFKYAHLSPKC